MKRARGSLTGGTGDVSPQQYNITLAQPNVDQNDIRTFPVPVYRFPLARDKAMVMEVLRAQYYIEDLLVGAAQGSIVGVVSTSKLPIIQTDVSTPAIQYNMIASPNTFSAFSLDFLFSTGAGFAFTSRIQKEDFTDSAGHGILIATDTITAALMSTGTGTNNRMTIKLIYRWKEVSLSEYIGIVQSQQNPTASTG